MGKFWCFTAMNRGKNKESGNAKSSPARKSLQIRLEQPVKPLENQEGNDSLSTGKVTSHGTPVLVEATEREYEGEDEREENVSIKRDFSDFDLQAHVESPQADPLSPVNDLKEEPVNKAEKDVRLMESGHVSDPGIGRAKYYASPELKRSCSNLETSEVLSKIANRLPRSKSQSFEDLEKLNDMVIEKNFNLSSPASVMTHVSADKVMLKKHSSSQILPSRSRRLWWKLFLWSHRNLHKGLISKPQLHKSVSHQHGGYCSDTIESSQALKSSKMESPSSFTGDSLNMDLNFRFSGDTQQGGFVEKDSGLWPHNHWVAFSAESSSLSRVDEWVKDLNTQSVFPIEDDEDEKGESSIIFPPSPEDGRSPHTRDVNVSEAVSHANSIIQTLNKSSTVAHISGIGLKAVPNISHFVSLRSVNLSNNFIARITPGSLPKGLHVLNLSKNKISTIEGLRELTRLRVLDISYNRISRIGQGLSKCTMIKELYLAGNKISDVEGLHRLLKLTVLDLSFNKITTTKAIGQLVANYNSLLALNLLGNPIQSNISDDQLRKAVWGLLPKLMYLNKQPIEPQRARDVLANSVAKAALGNNTTSSRRKTAKRGGSSRPASFGGRSSNVGNVQKDRISSKNRTSLRQKTASSPQTPLR